jgi:hypothetical protein
LPVAPIMETISEDPSEGSRDPQERG